MNKAKYMEEWSEIIARIKVNEASAMEEGGKMNTENNKWLTTQEAMDLTGYNPEQIRRLARKGKIKTRKWGTVWMIDKTSLMDYMTIKGHGPQPKRKTSKI